MQKIQLKKPYLAPELTVVDFKVERGLQASISPEQEIQLRIQSEMMGMGLVERYAQQNDGRGFEGFQTATGNGGYFGDGINGGSEYWF